MHRKQSTKQDQPSLRPGTQKHKTKNIVKQKIISLGIVKEIMGKLEINEIKERN